MKETRKTVAMACAALLWIPRASAQVTQQDGDFAGTALAWRAGRAPLVLPAAVVALRVSGAMVVGSDLGPGRSPPWGRLYTLGRTRCSGLSFSDSLNSALMED